MNDDTTPGTDLDTIPADLDGVEREIELVEEKMQNTYEYARSPRTQARATALYEAQERLQADPAPADQAVALTDGDVSNAIENVAAMGDVGRAWAAELSKGGAKGSLGVMEDTRRAILAGMGDSAEAVVQAFEGNLSDNAKAAVFKELSNPYVGQVPAADPADLATFAEGGAGKILVKEWRASARQNLARALFRWDRLTFGLDDADFAVLDDFYLNRLTDTERAAVLRQLAQ